MVVYLLTAGEYSDYHVVGVFSAEELAKAAKATYDAAHSAYDKSNDLEEYELDGLVNAADRTVHAVEIDTAGAVTNTSSWVKHWIGPRHAVGQTRTTWDRATKSYRVSTFYGESVVSPEHATKIAVEARQKWLREQAAVPPGTTSGLAEIDDVC